MKLSGQRTMKLLGFLNRQLYVTRRQHEWEDSYTLTFTLHCDKCGKDFVHTEGTGTDQHIICDDCLAKMRMKKEPAYSQQATFEGGIKK